MTAFESAMREHERYLWSLCYRMTGVAADADDLVQETFIRAIERPPANVEQPLKGWLTRVAVNLARDQLRRRKRAKYVGPWLPSPVETADEAIASVEPASTEGRYDLLESVSFAFLLALEALSPKQRAVLLLMDVFDYSVAEIAECLAMSPGNVKVVHHRARKAMADYDTHRCQPTRAAQARNRAALERFLSLLLEGDSQGMAAMLADSVKALTDGGGEFAAAKVPLFGPERLITFLRRLVEIRGAPDHAEVRLLNGLPALVASIARERCKPNEAPVFVLRIDLDEEGKIRDFHSVLASRKLTALLENRV